MMPKNTETRADWVDYAKGIGIILVVYAHLLSSAYHAGLKIPQDFFAYSDSIVYSFHMPLFFF
ncbi:MAG TPA: acyltransferase family protein, partial [Anaerolineales bacterium]|nr:acyltransferase family protein [Anaerolineales bacterium]